MKIRQGLLRLEVEASEAVPPGEVWIVQKEEPTVEVKDGTIIITDRYKILGRITNVTN